MPCQGSAEGCCRDAIGVPQGCPIHTLRAVSHYALSRANRFVLMKLDLGRGYRDLEPFKQDLAGIKYGAIEAGAYTRPPFCST
jgi:hypothetical protein